MAVCWGCCLGGSNGRAHRKILAALERDLGADLSQVREISEVGWA